MNSNILTLILTKLEKKSGDNSANKKQPAVIETYLLTSSYATFRSLEY